MSWSDVDLERNRMVSVLGKIMPKRDFMLSQGPACWYEDEVEELGGITIRRTYAVVGGNRTLALEQFWTGRGAMPEPGSNRFARSSFEDALSRILDMVDRVDPDEAREFREAYESELWYGRPTWLNKLDK